MPMDLPLPGARFRGAAAAVTILLIASLTGCVTETVVRLPEEPTGSAGTSASSASPSVSPAERNPEDLAGQTVECSEAPLEIAERADPRVDVVGSCPAVTVSGNDLTIDVSSADVGDLIIRADRVSVVAAALPSLSIAGYDVVVEAEGITAVTVSGDRNTVRSETEIDSVAVTGHDNTVAAANGIGEIDDAGERNTIG
ncbi:DUF3060 domain-containing protein [uncultured Microbacterium sp.]|uniref:DUF3060 domain-containing protein n=2 Tax=Microbacterium TaxID=33882 RepID=UPI000C3FE768|nr:DUF3060 domain-containing protein [uncultured Microbacterium sp.]MAM54825.1 hypothetical protein [Microbacterium sp.]